ncbi:MAG: efflux RND transporter periplasmic adaptor subunit [Planctomycetota bacterium]
MTSKALAPVASILAALMLSGSGGTATAGGEAARTPRVHAGRFQNPVGISVPSQSALIAPEQAGKLVELTVRDGDKVEANQPLFRLNATLEELEVSRLERLTKSDLFERRARKTVEYAQRELNRAQNLHDRDISSEQVLQKFQHELDLAMLSLEQAQMEKQQVLNQLAQARELLDQRTVRAPFAGRVTARFRGEGEAVEKFAPVVEVMSLDPLWIEFECPFTSQHLFQMGGTVWVAPAMRPDDVRQAKITFVSPKANASSHSYMVRASLPNASLAWKSGLKMTVEPGEEQTPSKPGK